MRECAAQAKVIEADTLCVSSSYALSTPYHYLLPSMAKGQLLRQSPGPPSVAARRPLAAQCAASRIAHSANGVDPLTTSVDPLRGSTGDRRSLASCQERNVVRSANDGRQLIAPRSTIADVPISPEQQQRRSLRERCAAIDCEAINESSDIYRSFASRTIDKFASALPKQRPPKPTRSPLSSGDCHGQPLASLAKTSATRECAAQAKVIEADTLGVSSSHALSTPNHYLLPSMAKSQLLRQSPGPPSVAARRSPSRCGIAQRP